MIRRALFLASSFLIAACITAPCGAFASAPSIAPARGTWLRDLGPASASTRVRIAVVLRYHHESELDALVEAQGDPDSSLYHRFLNPRQFANYFAPTAIEYGRVATTLRGAGFSITHTFRNRTVIDATAPAPTAARYFDTEIHRVLSRDGRVTYANIRPGTVPSTISGAVLAVIGLDAAQRLHPAYTFAPRHTAALHRPLVPGAEPVFGPDGGYGPLVYINSYALPAAGGNNGNGRASGVATDNDFLDSDLSSYLSYFGITPTGPATTRVLVDGGPPPGLGPDSVETTLDVETIVSIAPGTALYVYEAPYDEPTNANFIDIFNAVVADDYVDTLNSSYIYCETYMEQNYNGYPQALDAVEKQGGAEGITFHAATGDSGAYSPGCYSQVSVGVPSSTPHDIAVGGTTLYVDSSGHETNEVGWGGTGGGVSAVFKLPGYQKKVQNIIPGGRNLPDLAFDADPGTGESLYYGGYWSGPIGGTSLASPIFGAALTELNQVRGTRSGFFNRALYKTWRKYGYGSGSLLYFRDITQGSIEPYSAGPGYDQMSGIGAMLVNNFAKILR